MQFTVYTDGGCHGNKRDNNCPGGYGYILLDPGGNKIAHGGGREINTTNNRMEMMAVIKGIKTLLKYIRFYYGEPSSNECIVKTDSKYVCENFDDYLPGWKKNGWRKSKGGTVLNKDLWLKIDELTPEFRSFRFQWVKGHAKDKWNNLADSIAQDHIKRSKLLPQT